jgi:competence protein ComEC
MIGRKMNRLFNEALSIGVAALSKKVLSKKNFSKKASPIEAYSIEAQKRKPNSNLSRHKNALPLRCKTTFIFAMLCIVFGIRTVSITWAQAESPAIADRYDQVFSRENNEKSLTAWFLRLLLSEESNTDEKSGDSTIVISPDNKVMLIDGGAPSCGAMVCSYLHALGIDRIDAIVVSHPHIDHIGGLISVLQEFPVEVIYMSKLEYPTAIFQSFLTNAAEKEIPIIYLEEGSEFDLGSKIHAKVYNPEANIVYYSGYPANSTLFVNDRSLVIKFAFGNSSMLFMGDVYTSRELDLIEKYGSELKADVLKVGHHGSDTSSSKSFIRLVSPEIAVIMHDRLASLQVYNNLRKIGAAVYLSPIDGNIRVSIDDEENMSVITQFDRISDFLK